MYKLLVAKFGQPTDLCNYGNRLMMALHECSANRELPTALETDQTRGPPKKDCLGWNYSAMFFGCHAYVCLKLVPCNGK
jgi:hypothetical protein